MFYAYLMASRRNGTLYAGSTDSMMRRAWEHREEIRRGFTAKYGVHLLVWFQAFETREGAKMKERQIKEWKRAWKLELIEGSNPDWRDLYETLFALSPEDGAQRKINGFPDPT